MKQCQCQKLGSAILGKIMHDSRERLQYGIAMVVGSTHLSGLGLHDLCAAVLCALGERVNLLMRQARSI